ncbi:MAG: hypothetical protein A2V86_12185 [Deltaproteobacteria bacterium RBG_16_49_23]|nr:MAG: hypothetical protein A2V86_12185 [Deltaproteobacteria bacterium RBG_16_49_23]
MIRMDPLVIISKGKGPYDTTRIALKRFPLPDLENRRILIKPNAARLASPGEGVTTHPLVVSATIDHLRENGIKEIAIGEGCIFGVDPQEAFRKTGFAEMSEKKGVKLIDLDRFDPAERIIPDGRLLKKVKVSSALNDFDWIISIPVMKTHMHTHVSLSIKNMKGLLWRREKARLHQLRSDESIGRGHKALDLAISEMATILMPDLTIIDGTVGMEGMGPAYGKLKEMGIILVSDYALSADAVAARLMGFNPESIPHLKLCSEMGMGEIQLQKISIKPKDFLKWETPFEPSPSTLSISFPDVVVYDEGSCSGCLSTLLVFLREYHSQLDGYQMEDKNIHIGIGKHLKTCPDGTILIGNCTMRMKRRGIFVRGCPPVSSQIMRTLSQKRSR